MPVSPIRAKVRERERHQRAAACMERQAAHRRKDHSRWRDAFAEIVACMTNAERTRWAAQGYPGLRNRDETQASVFLGAGKDRRLAVRRENLAIAGGSGSV